MISFLMANANYQMKHSLANCCTKALILVGSKEQDIMKKSAEIVSFINCAVALIGKIKLPSIIAYWQMSFRCDKTSTSICPPRAKALILVGSKEQDIMKKSAEIIHQTIRNSSLEVFPGFYHGDISINHPDLYVEKMYRLIEQL